MTHLFLSVVKYQILSLIRVHFSCFSVQYTFPISLNSGVRPGMILRILLALRIVSAFGQDPSDRKNVLLIIADDFRPNVGVLESENSFSSVAMVTPNLDRLAARSLVLTNAYTQVSALHCSPVLCVKRNV